MLVALCTLDPQARSDSYIPFALKLMPSISSRCTAIPSSGERAKFVPKGVEQNLQQLLRITPC